MNTKVEDLERQEELLKNFSAGLAMFIGDFKGVVSGQGDHLQLEYLQFVNEFFQQLSIFLQIYGHVLLDTRGNVWFGMREPTSLKHDLIEGKDPVFCSGGDFVGRMRLGGAWPEELWSQRSCLSNVDRTIHGRRMNLTRLSFITILLLYTASNSTQQ